MAAALPYVATGSKGNGPYRIHCDGHLCGIGGDKMLKLSLALLWVSIAGAIGGCAWFTSPMERPIIEDHSHDGRITTFATIPSRRMVVVTEHEKGSGNIIVCAEPSADVSDNIASSLAAAITAKGPIASGPSSAELAASISKTMATTAQHLFKRSQGLQLYRDGMYNLCQARMNGIIGNAAYQEGARAILAIAVELIKIEIPQLATTQPTNVAGPSPAPAAASTTGGNTSTSVGGPNRN
jgi:hypothetical protein